MAKLRTRMGRREMHQHADTERRRASDVELAGANQRDVAEADVASG